MTFFYKGREIGQRGLAAEYICDLPTRELERFVYSYLDLFERAQLEYLIWASVDDKGWTMRELIEDALIMMENKWEDSHAMGKLAEGETVELGDLEYENWAWSE